MGEFWNICEGYAKAAERRRPSIGYARTLRTYSGYDVAGSEAERDFRIIHSMHVVSGTVRSLDDQCVLF